MCAARIGVTFHRVMTWHQNTRVDVSRPLRSWWGCLQELQVVFKEVEHRETVKNVPHFWPLAELLQSCEKALWNWLSKNKLDADSSLIYLLSPPKCSLDITDCIKTRQLGNCHNKSFRMTGLRKVHWNPGYFKGAELVFDVFQSLVQSLKWSQFGWHYRAKFQLQFHVEGINWKPRSCRTKFYTQERKIWRKHCRKTPNL